MAPKTDEVIRPKIARWSLMTRERGLFDTCTQLPTWRLADNCRRALLDVCHQLSGRVPEPPDVKPEEVDTDTARQAAAIALAGLVSRAVGAHMMLIATGYEREALAHLRVVTEATLRLRQSNADASGRVARSLLVGRPLGGLKSVAHKYGRKHEIELLDHFAHADVLSIRTLGELPGPGRRVQYIQLQPQRGRLLPAWQLLEVARGAMGMSAGLIEAFELTLWISPWISGQLRHYADNPLPDPL